MGHSLGDALIVTAIAAGDTAPVARLRRADHAGCAAARADANGPRCDRRLRAGRGGDGGVVDAGAARGIDRRGRRDQHSGRCGGKRLCATPPSRRVTGSSPAS
jgi:hypothetical protein